MCLNIQHRKDRPTQRPPSSLSEFSMSSFLFFSFLSRWAVAGPTAHFLLVSPTVSQDGLHGHHLWSLPVGQARAGPRLWPPHGIPAAAPGSGTIAVLRFAQGASVKLSNLLDSHSSSGHTSSIWLRAHTSHRAALLPSPPDG